MENKQIVSNASKGYGYNYAALEDIANQGFDIPLMRTGTDPISLKDYVYYYNADFKDDPDTKGWLRGAEIVIPDSKGQNAAQLYGSALTYSRRYTTFMADKLASSDDKNIEDIKGDGTSKSQPTKVTYATVEQVDKIMSLYDMENIKSIKTFYNVDNLEKLTVQQASQVIANKAKKEAK